MKPAPSGRLTTNLNALLDCSALLSGSLPLYLTDVNFHEVIKSTKDLVFRDFRRGSVSLTTEVARNVPSIHADFRRVVQMLAELLDNARKATPSGGRVGIRVTADSRRVRISVWDTGKGIPPSELDSIWTAFASLNSQEEDQVGGLGLGLAIVKNLAELHGGRVAVESRIGAGTCFEVVLPIAGPRSGTSPALAGFSPSLR